MTRPKREKKLEKYKREVELIKQIREELERSPVDDTYSYFIEPDQLDRVEILPTSYARYSIVREEILKYGIFRNVEREVLSRLIDKITEIVNRLQSSKSKVTKEDIYLEIRRQLIPWSLPERLEKFIEINTDENGAIKRILVSPRLADAYLRSEMEYFAWVLDQHLQKRAEHEYTDSYVTTTRYILKFDKESLKIVRHKIKYLTTEDGKVIPVHHEIKGDEKLSDKFGIRTLKKTYQRIWRKLEKLGIQHNPFPPFLIVLSRYPEYIVGVGSSHPAYQELRYLKENIHRKHKDKQPIVSEAIQKIMSNPHIIMNLRMMGIKTMLDKNYTIATEHGEIILEPHPQEPGKFTVTIKPEKGKEEHEITQGEIHYIETPKHVIISYQKRKESRIGSRIKKVFRRLFGK